MASPPKNTCTPDEVYGPFGHTMFLGCSVLSMSGSHGWNEQQSELTILLAQDPCGGSKIYWDENSDQQEWTDPDPGFMGLDYPIVGAPAIFRVGNFSFGGIIQSWEEVASVSGNPTYQVKMVDMRQLLENVQIIIGDYGGGVGSVYNIVNAYGYMESLGVSCPPTGNLIDGAIFGSESGAFGGSDTNRNGMQWNQILVALNVLLAGTTSVWSPYGHIAFKASSGAGFGLLGQDVTGLAYYKIDLSELPIAPTYWRLNGTNVSLLEAISQICQDAGQDYFIRLLHIGGDKYIKVETIDRTSQPGLTSIQDFVDNFDGRVKEYKRGRELRSEPTSSFVIGGLKQGIYQAEQDEGDEGSDDDIIIPYFGLNPNTGDVYIPEKDADGWWEIEMTTQALTVQLQNNKYNKSLPTSVTINEQELQAAAAGLDTWQSYASFNNTDLWVAIDVAFNKGIWDIEHLIEMIKNIDPTDNFRPADIVAAHLSARVKVDDANASDWEVIQIAYAWINSIVEEYYGRMFQVRVPFTCGRIDSESSQIILSDQPNDGGWTENTPVIGIAHPTIFSDFFTLPDNRLGSFCRLDNATELETSNLNINDYILEEDTFESLWVKVDVESEYVYEDVDTLFGPRIVFSLPQRITPSEIAELGDESETLKAFAQLVHQVYKGTVAGAERDNAVQKIKDTHLKAGVSNLKTAMISRPRMPDAVAVGIQSNALTYGPWGAGTAAGGVMVVQDSGLVPWEYGGYTTMNLAGNAKASEAITLQQVAEEGSVTVVGFPERNLGSELASGNIENGAIVTGVNVTYGDQGVETTYDVRTWSPKKGTFLRGNAERLKQIGQNNLKFNKQLRNFSLNRLIKQQLGARAKNAPNRDAVNIKDGAHNGPPRSPHEVFTGNLNSWNGGEFKRPVVTTGSMVDLRVEIGNGYEDKAIMSLDGLIRPFSISGSGGLPRYATPSLACQKSRSVGSQTPVLKENGEEQYNISTENTYLNPFANPFGTFVSERANSDHGHDIEILARGSSPPASSMVMPIQGYADEESFASSDYESDYRPFCLRGPLIIGGWGYNLDGKPVPNEADSEVAASGGIFATTGLTNKFMDDFLRKSHTWPVGPVDLRWDHHRAVWTIPQNRKVVTQLMSDIEPFGTGLAQVIDGPVLYDNNGIQFDPFVVVGDYVGNTLTSGTKTIADYDPYDCSYRVIESIDNSGIHTTVIPSSICSVEDLIDFSGGHVNHINFYRGIKISGIGIEGEITDHIALDAGFEWVNDSGTDYSERMPTGIPFGNTVNIGRGLRLAATEEEGCPDCECGVYLGLAVEVGGIVGSMITLGSGLMATDGGDGIIHLDAASGVGFDPVEYVVDVYCSGTGIVMVTNYLHFDAYGRFQGTSEDGEL